MKVLLDTCTALWAAVSPEKLSKFAAEAIQNGGNECFFSAVSIWEISLKHGLGKLELPDPPQILLPQLRKDLRLSPLPFDEAAAVFGGTLPFHHNDPFDRMLVSQAIANGVPILTPDAHIGQYPVRVVW